MTGRIETKIGSQVAEQLRRLDSNLAPMWDLGRNMVAAWSADGRTLRLLVVDFYRLLRIAEEHPAILRGSRYMTADAFADLRTLLAVEPWEIHCEFRVGSKHGEVPWRTVERLIRRYAIMETTNRAVILLDIVGFSKLTSIQRIAQLNSLEYSINSSQRLLQQNGLSVELAKSTTGDGFYIWNRETGAMANIALFIVLTFILADNALCNTKDTKSFVPLLRAAFSVGSHLSYHQIDGLMPRGYDYIVGDVTISLARLIEKAHPKQILIGDFKDTSGEAHTAADTLDFIEKIKRLIRKFHGVILGNTPVSDLKLSLTNSRKSSSQGQPSQLSPKKYTITDKHGMKHDAYNVQITVERAGAFPLYLGDEAVLAGH
jgi:hypothetical protein